ncbi:MAG TPA: methyltransferase [Rhodanobacteraceae bacterium]|nr:methyltransferase [Rhodanobacteraceae bacterium]
MNKFALLLPVAVLLAACSGQQDPDSTVPPPAPAAGATSESSPPQAPQATPPDAFSERLDRVLAGAWRPPADRARDQYRHPRETLQFFGLQPGQTVIEITPGAGWYAAILAPLMRGDGTYVAAIAKPRNPKGEGAANQSALEKLFASDPSEFDAAQQVMFDGDAPVFGPPGSADVVLTFRNVHNWARAGTAENMFNAFFTVLKPGGTLGVADHRAAPGKTLEQVSGSGYLPPDYVIKLATDAGFRLVARSKINANPKDNRDHPKGVWTLPPTLTLGDTDRDKYLAIGESDRMTLKFEKPMNSGQDHGAPASAGSVGIE